MTRIYIDLRKGKLTAQGHAGYGERGKDVVCAGISALTQTAAIAAIKAGGTAWAGDGEIHMSCHAGAYKHVLHAIVDGLEEMAKQYPEHMMLVIEGR